jgi:hypothetical protein
MHASGHATLLLQRHHDDATLFCTFLQVPSPHCCSCLIPCSPRVLSRMQPRHSATSQPMLHAGMFAPDRGRRAANMVSTHCDKQAHTAVLRTVHNLACLGSSCWHAACGVGHLGDYAGLIANIYNPAGQVPRHKFVLTCPPVLLSCTAQSTHQEQWRCGLPFPPSEGRLCSNHAGRLCSRTLPAGCT